MHLWPVYRRYSSFLFALIQFQSHILFTFPFCSLGSLWLSLSDICFFCCFFYITSKINFKFVSGNLMTLFSAFVFHYFLFFFYSFAFIVVWYWWLVGWFHTNCWKLLLVQHIMLNTCKFAERGEIVASAWMHNMSDTKRETHDTCDYMRGDIFFCVYERTTIPITAV